MRFDTVIAGGTVHTHESSYVGDVGIVGEKVAAVGRAGELAVAARRVIDASGMDVIPGCVDVHVHLGLPFCGTVSCDDYRYGSHAALNGCVTTVIDFAIPSMGQTLADAHGVWMAKAAGVSLVDFSWHMAITKREHLSEVAGMVARGLPTFKEFMIYEREGWNSDDAMIFGALELMKEHGGMLLIHAESPRVLDMLIERHHTPELMRRHGARLHRMTRPNFIEAEAIERGIHWCERTGGRLYIVHMSTGEGAELVKAARGRGVPVTAETCVQYLTLTDEVFDRPDGHLYACCPQVKKSADVERLWAGLGDEVSVVSTDTCSFTREQKGMWWKEASDGGPGYGDWTTIPMGLPGLDTLVPLMYTKGVRGGRLTMNGLVDLCSTTPARLMGLGGRKGQLLPGFDADVAIIDPGRTVAVEPGVTVKSAADWSPFAGWKLGGFARTALVRGEVMLDEYEVVGKAGHGRFVERRLG